MPQGLDFAPELVCKVTFNMEADMDRVFGWHQGKHIRIKISLSNPYFPPRDPFALWGGKTCSSHLIYTQELNLLPSNPGFSDPS